MVFNLVISTSQSTFLKGRNHVDGVMVINELVDLAKKLRKECLIFKVDFEQVYDFVDWDFLEYMLVRVGFCFSGFMRNTVALNLFRGFKVGRDEMEILHL